jgi:lantibiotic modifying enzyme
MPNIPYIEGRYAQLGDYMSAFIEGFQQYGEFILMQRERTRITNFFGAFKQLLVRKVIRNTRFYYMLLQRLKDHRNMSGGVT